MKALLVATNNHGKLRELRALLRDIGATLVTPEEVGLQLSVEEDGLTYRQNAEKKAALHAVASGLISLGDDTGLEVDALGGAPGLHSKRYLGRADASDAERRAYLLENLRGTARPWKARFRAAVAIAIPEGPIECAEGECPGEIIPEERGSNGFGYDAIFEVEGTGRTMAELALDEKNRLSHRARAVTRIMPLLRQLVLE